MVDDVPTLEEALDAHYQRTADFAFGPVVPGRDVCDLLRVYRVEAPPEHYHYVALGLSAHRSAPIELTFRLAVATAPGEPPLFPLAVLQNVARLFAKTGLPVADGHILALNGPIALDRPTEIVAVALASDPTLGPPFLQLVGLTADEYDAARRWHVHGVLGLLAEDNPLLVTDLARGSRLTGRADIEQAIEAAGSSLTAHHASNFDALPDGAGARIDCGAAHVTRLYGALASRIGRGRTFEVRSRTAHVVFTPADVAALRWDDRTLHIDVCSALLAELAGILRPARGIVRSQVLDGLTFSIAPSVIRGPNGEALETIG